MSSFNDKVIAITGATGGIGLAVAKLLASRGATLSLADLHQSAVDSLVSSLESSGCKCLGVAVDVRQSSQVDAWIAKTVEKFGRLDGAANLAGVIGSTEFKGVGDMDDKNWDLIIGVNLTGVMYSLRAEIRAFGEGKGSVVNAASIAGLIGRPGVAAYSTSKHGVIGLTKSAAKEYGKQGIRVNAVCPGPIETPMLDQILGTTTTAANKEGVTNTYNTLPLRRKGHAEEAAAAVAYLLSDDSSYVTGVAFPVDGGLTS
ncbi:NAD(P)-binding protein [Viridothelium virens]|uniref:NAD(P)-binding protein n=1 Tax=Viridothelium virens TaxID=1048519 RepID=A0A6A6GTL8_VIRVR|nr:NAD(P)-binding protein [Viridothelium virens]